MIGYTGAKVSRTPCLAAKGKRTRSNDPFYRLLQRRLRMGMTFSNPDSYAPLYKHAFISSAAPVSPVVCRVPRGRTRMDACVFQRGRGDEPGRQVHPLKRTQTLCTPTLVIPGNWSSRLAGPLGTYTSHSIRLCSTGPCLVTREEWTSGPVGPDRQRGGMGRCRARNPRHRARNPRHQEDLWVETQRLETATRIARCTRVTRPPRVCEAEGKKQERYLYLCDSVPFNGGGGGGGNGRQRGGQNSVRI